MVLSVPAFIPQEGLYNKIIKKLRLQKPSVSESYGAIDVVKGELRIVYTKHGKVTSHKSPVNYDYFEDAVQKEVKKIFSVHNHKLIATSFKEKTLFDKIAPKLWLEEDIVSFMIKDQEHDQNITVEERLKTVVSSFDKNNIANIKVTKDNEVLITDLVSLSDYKKICSSEEFTKLLLLSKKFHKKKISYINATPQGGGIAIMRHGLLRLFKLLKLDVHWYVLTPDLEAFNVTKRKFHNILQAVSNSKLELTEKDKKIYNDWINKNAEFFQHIFKDSDIIVIDDPQPAGLIPYIKKVNPLVKIVYRSHIQIESDLVAKKGTPQYKTWRFLWSFIKHADIFISHPVASFVPKDVPKEKVVFMPAVTDPLDGLNKPLKEEQTHYYLSLFNRFLKEENQTLLDLRRPYIIQIARFDPSKGIPDVLKAYLKLTDKLAREKQPRPQLVITGNGSVDDPDRQPMLDMVKNIIDSKEYSHLKKDIKVAALPHIDQLLNTLLRRSKIVLQLSTKEGFEIKVTEALMKRKPVIAYKTGGIPLQIKDGVNGFLVNKHNTDQVAQHLFDLLTNEELYKKMSLSAEMENDKSLLTIPNAIRWLSLGLKVLKS